MSANVALTDTFDQWRVKTNELLVGTQTDGMSNFIKLLDTTNSTSNTTGSIITAGGVGIAKCVVIGEDLRVHGDVITDGDTTISGNLIFGDAATDQVTFSADINSSLIPNANLTFNVGNTTMLWANTWTGHLGVTQKTDSGKAAVSVTSQDADQIAIEVTASQTTADVVQLTSDSVSSGKVIDISADALTTGSAIYIDSDSSDTGTRSIVNIIQNHASATGATALSVQSDAGKGIFVDSNLAAGGPSIEVDSEHTTATAIEINVDPTTTATAFNLSADGLTTGSMMALTSDSSDTGTRTLVSIKNDHASATAAVPLVVTQDSTNCVAKFVGQSTIVVPVGTTAQRGHAVQGGMRYNTTTSSFEGYSGSSWAGLGGLIDVDQDTKIIAETSAGADNDDLDFYTAGTQRMKIDETGVITVGVDDTGYDVKFFGATTGKSWLWDESADKMIITGDTQLTGTLYVGVSDTGHDVVFYGATAGKYWMWDESADKMTVTGTVGLENTLTVGVDDTGHDVKFFGATSGKYWEWDESNDQVTVNGTQQFSGTVTVGVDDTGWDVKFFGATSGKYMLWDESADTLTVAGTITETSSRELKTNIEPLENILPAVLQMQGVKFDWKEGADDNYGFIAEEVDKIFPHLVSHDTEGKPQAIQYTKMTAVLVEAIKEQQKQIDDLKSKIN